VFVFILLLTLTATVMRVNSAVATPHELNKLTDRQTLFSTPEEAVRSLVVAAKEKDKSTLVAILGKEAEKLLFSGDEVQDNYELNEFSAAENSSKLDKVNDDTYTITIGKEKWPFPIIKVENLWRFDTHAGVEDILNRRIGENELSVIMVCRAYVLAQWQYFTEEETNKEGVAEYAQKFISSPGKRDGLYWKTSEGEKPSPLGNLVASARAEGYRPKGDRSTSKRAPYHGYFFKILTRQGAHAPGGKYSFIINGHMIAGYALIAYPDKWGSSGVMTFIVNQQGRIYEKNLGPKTSEIARTITEYNPDPSWKRVKE
jgi:Protein of unknown function (DUF2950)